MGELLFVGKNIPCLNIPVPKAKVTSALWGYLDEMLLTGHESGDLIQWDVTVRLSTHFSAIISVGSFKSPERCLTKGDRLSASQFPRSRNRGRNRGISYLKRNFQCETEKNGKCFFTKGPLLVIRQST